MEYQSKSTLFSITILTSVYIVHFLYFLCAFFVDTQDAKERLGKAQDFPETSLHGEGMIEFRYPERWALEPLQKRASFFLCLEFQV